MPGPSDATPSTPEQRSIESGHCSFKHVKHAVLSVQIEEQLLQLSPPSAVGAHVSLAMPLSHFSLPSIVPLPQTAAEASGAASTRVSGPLSMEASMPGPPSALASALLESRASAVASFPPS